MAVILLFSFSPAARAALQTILSYNGVNVSVDSDTNTLIVSGNLDAVVEQTDHSVTIQGENGEEAGAGIASAQAVASMSISDLLTIYPNLVLPNVPAGYTLNPEGEAAGEMVKVTWQDASGHLIMYERSPAPDPGEQVATTEGIDSPVINSGSGSMSIDGQSVPILVYSWEDGGYLFELTFTDVSMEESAQQAMLPK